MKTKFNIDDNVWFIRNDKPQNDRIESIHIYKDSTCSVYITYNTIKWHNLSEKEIFKTAKQAIESLYNTLENNDNKYEQQIICD